MLECSLVRCSLIGALLLMQVSCATPRSNTQVQQDNSTAHLLYLTSEHESEALAVAAAVYLGKAAVEWEADKYTQVSHATRQGVSDGREYPVRRPRLNEHDKVLFSFIRLTAPKPGWSSWWRQRLNAQPKELEAFNSEMAFNLADSVKQQLGERMPPFEIMQLLGITLPTDEEHDEFVRQFGAAWRRRNPSPVGESGSDRNVNDVVTKVLAPFTEGEVAARVKEECNTVDKRGGRRSIRFCLIKLMSEVNAYYDSAIKLSSDGCEQIRTVDNKSASQASDCDAKGKCEWNPVPVEEVQQLLNKVLAGPIAALCTRCSPKWEFSLALVGELEPLKDARDLFRLRVLGYQYSSLKAKNLSFWTWFLNWHKTESVALITISGPQSPLDQKPAEGKFRLVWDRDGAKSKLPSHWERWDGLAKGGSEPLNAFQLPDTRDLSISVTVSEDSDLTGALNGLAEIVGKIK